MAAPILPPIQSLPTQPTPTLSAILDTLFEPSQPLHNLSIDLLRTQTFDSYNDLIASVGVQLTALMDSSVSSDTAWLDDILGAHPRLGEKKVDSEQSRSEQAGLNIGPAGEAQALKELNDAYEAAFPGLKYVVFVDGRPRDVIMADMHARIERGDLKAERVAAIKAMCDIAADRARKLLS